MAIQDLLHAVLGNYSFGRHLVIQVTPLGWRQQDGSVLAKALTHAAIAVRISLNLKVQKKGAENPVTFHAARAYLRCCLCSNVPLLALISIYRLHPS